MNKYFKLSIASAALVLAGFIVVPINLSSIYSLDTTLTTAEISTKLNRAELVNVIVFSSIVLFSITSIGFAIYGFTRKQK